MEASEPAPSQTRLEAKPLEESPSIGYICPLYLELAAVLATFDENLGTKEIGEDDYYYGRIGFRKAVAVHFLHEEMGPQTASKYADRLLKEHPSLQQPTSICLLVGTAGGIWTQERDIRLGDAVIATRIWNWRDGKLTENGLETTNYPENVSRRLRRKLPAFLYDRDALALSLARRVQLMRDKDKRNTLKWTCPGQAHDILYHNTYFHTPGSSCALHDPFYIINRGQRDNNLPKVHGGLLASGNVVLKDSKSRDLLHKRRVDAVEMEACGIPANFFVVRGISDYADSHKNDIWQPYAAAVAAACSRLLVDHFIVTENHQTSELYLLGSFTADARSMEHARNDSGNLLTFSNSESELPTKTQRHPLHATNLRAALLAEDLLPTNVKVTSSSEEPRQASLPPASRSDLALTNEAISTQEVTTANSTRSDHGVAVGALQSWYPGSAAPAEKCTAAQLNHPEPRHPGEICYSGSWKYASFTMLGSSARKTQLVRKESWIEPSVDLIRWEGAAPFPASLPCYFVAFSTAGMSEGVQDLVWLPLDELRIQSLRFGIKITYKALLRSKGDQSSIYTRATQYTRIVAHIVLEPGVTANNSQLDLIKKLLTLCRSRLPDAISPKPTFDDGISCFRYERGSDVLGHILHIHKLSDLGSHECAMLIFQEILKFRIEQGALDVTLRLTPTRRLLYHTPLSAAFLAVSKNSVPPWVGVTCIPTNEEYEIRRSANPHCAENLLNDTIGKMTGWTAIYASDSARLSEVETRSKPRSRLSRFIALDLTRPNEYRVSKFSLTIWRKDDYIRFVFNEHTEPRAIDADDRLTVWTIRAGHGEISTSWAFREQIRFSVVERSKKDGGGIRLAAGDWFCTDTEPNGPHIIGLYFTKSDELSRFKTTIPLHFWSTDSYTPDSLNAP